MKGTGEIFDRMLKTISHVQSEPIATSHTLANELGIGVRMAQRYLADLHKLGYLRVIKKHDFSCCARWKTTNKINEVLEFHTSR